MARFQPVYLRKRNNNPWSNNHPSCSIYEKTSSTYLLYIHSAAAYPSLCCKLESVHPPHKLQYLVQLCYRKVVYTSHRIWNCDKIKSHYYYVNLIHTSSLPPSVSLLWAVHLHCVHGECSLFDHHMTLTVLKPLVVGQAQSLIMQGGMLASGSQVALKCSFPSHTTCMHIYKNSSIILLCHYAVHTWLLFTHAQELAGTECTACVHWHDWVHTWVEIGYNAYHRPTSYVGVLMVDHQARQ